MSNKIFMYGDQHTADILQTDVPKVILFGGYLGYNNFGDILQLKEAIKFHESVTKLTPVVICHINSIPDDYFQHRLRNWFNAAAFIFVHDHPMNNLEMLNLCLVEKSFPIKNMHLYGGGFLNRYWGEYFLKLVEGLIQNFKVDNYVISGQQVDAALKSRLASHFQKCKPCLIGARDYESQAIINSCGFKCEFSFDDASNIIDAWGLRKPHDQTAGPQQPIFIHLNTSKYTCNSTEENKKELDRLKQVLKTLSETFAQHEPVVLNAYSEYRASVKDSLSSIVSLEDSFPFNNYRVIDIAHLALLHDPMCKDADSDLVGFGRGVAFSSSYHTAVFCNMLKTPCYMISENDYYNQKREGLGEARTLEQFLSDPSALSFGSLMDQRDDWLKKLDMFFRNVDRRSTGKHISFDYDLAAYVPESFRYKEYNSVKIAEASKPTIFSSVASRLRQVLSVK
ncbi:hypothetical protein [Geobacter sp. DSM 9736]|uniref:hypothetical protein n=1 Tax=Geobacter sp. DSM 9736 TaxID=1277350 RepID=UPI000B500251|nr:hypothetical protein [Geobacter sp. DSM 9736]SNB46630.1 hypothetical protein SAMN06269301_2098 [Geobacter sp. DSM 9736]